MSLDASPFLVFWLSPGEERLKPCPVLSVLPPGGGYPVVRRGFNDDLMNKSLYNKAIRWIACNDQSLNLNAHSVTYLHTSKLLAELSGVSTKKIASDIIKVRLDEWEDTSPLGDAPPPGGGGDP